MTRQFSRKFTIFLLTLFLAFVGIGCVASGLTSTVKKTVEQKDEKLIDRTLEMTSINGEIDYIREAEALSQTEGEVVVTIIGFKAGQGVILAGIYPGLREGKKVKIYLGDKIMSYKGTSVFNAKKIEAESEDRKK